MNEGMQGWALSDAEPSSEAKSSQLSFEAAAVLRSPLIGRAGRAR